MIAYSLITALIGELITIVHSISARTFRFCHWLRFRTRRRGLHTRRCTLGPVACTTRVWAGTFAPFLILRAFILEMLTATIVPVVLAIC